MKALILLAAAALSACANRPGSPGAGYGADYTPVIDMQGVDPARYEADLADCRRYAAQVDPNRATMEGIIGGAILGAALGASFGNRGMARAGAQGGATGGALGAGAAAVGQQKRIMINCMAGRGYRALDAAFVLPPSPAPIQVMQPGVAPAYQPSTAIPGCGWVGYEWKCAK